MSVKNGTPPGVPMVTQDDEIQKNGGDAMSEKVQYYYKHTDRGPFKVTVEKMYEATTTDTRKAGINKIGVGVVLQQNGFNKSILDIKKAAFAKVTVYLDSWKEANRLVNCQNLILKKLKAYIPKSFMSIKGVVNGVPEELTMEEILPNIDKEVDILEIFRMTRKTVDGNRTPIRKIGIVFRSNILPDTVRIFRVVTKVEPFTTRIVLCEKCLRYGHMTTNCKASTSRCTNCAGRHEGTCENATRCAHCKREHKTTDPECPERNNQQTIRILMAKKTITYQEAREQCRVETKNSYSILQNMESFPSYLETVKATHDAQPRQTKGKKKENINPPQIKKNSRNENKEEENSKIQNIRSIEQTTKNKKRKPSEHENFEGTEQQETITVQRHTELRQRWEEQIKKTANQKEQILHAATTAFNTMTALLNGKHENGYAIVQKMQNELGKSLGLISTYTNTHSTDDGQISDSSE